jgi:hypothetical protein
MAQTSNTLIIFRVEGDPDYMSVNHRSVEDIDSLLDVVVDDTRLDPSHVFKLVYTFDEPIEDGVVTDCPHTGAGATLVLSNRAVEALQPMFSRSGALFASEPEHEMQYKTFVCYLKLDALDKQRSRFHEYHEYIVRYEFDAAAVGDANIFRLTSPINRLYVTERFVHEVLRHRLSGFRFKRVWSSATGGVTLDDPVMEFERFAPGSGSSRSEKRQAMRDLIASWRSGDP